ncbi:MAG: hypothetical protein DWQ01_08440 [Planctomycetota bacterium]|nr:MAG: hypothetical protein DWQ01_08440 [Planctomycetota bacterium]
MQINGKLVFNFFLVFLFLLPEVTQCQDGKQEGDKLRLEFQTELREGGDVEARECSWTLRVFGMKKNADGRRHLILNGDSARKFSVEIPPERLVEEFGLPRWLRIVLRLASPCGFEYEWEDQFIVTEDRRKSWNLTFPPFYRFEMKVIHPGLVAPTKQQFVVCRLKRKDGKEFGEVQGVEFGEIAGYSHCDQNGKLEFVGLPVGYYKITSSGRYEEWYLKESKYAFVPHKGQPPMEIVLEKFSPEEYCSFWLRVDEGKEIDPKRIIVRPIQPAPDMRITLSRSGRVCVKWVWDWGNPRVEVYDREKDLILVPEIKVENGWHNGDIHLPLDIISTSLK